MTRAPLKNAEHVEEFTSLEVSGMTGATLRQLQWWDERGVVHPSFWRGNRPFELAAHIARCFKPAEKEEVA